MAQQLRPSKSGSKKPNIDWSRREEADNLIMTARNLAYKDREMIYGQKKTKTFNIWQSKENYK